MEEVHDLATPLAAASAQTPNVLETIYMGIPWDIVTITYVMIFVDLFYGIIVSTVLGEVISHKILKGLRSKTFVLFVPIIGIIMKMFFVVCSLPAEWSGSSALVGLFGVSQMAQFPICFLLCLIVMFMEFISFIETSARIDKRAKRLLGVIQRNVKDKAPVKHKKDIEGMFDDEDISINMS